MRTAETGDDDMPDEIDFSSAERARYAGRISADATVALLESEVTAVFPDSNAVNAALRMVMRSGVPAAGRASSRKRQAS